MTQARTLRLESEMQRVLAALVARELKDPRVGNVTITAVRLAPDHASARVFFTPFAQRFPPAQVHAGLSHAAGFLRGELGRRLALRHAPRLEFVFDESVERAAQLTRLIDRAVGGAAGGLPGTAAGGTDSDAQAADSVGRAADSGEPAADSAGGDATKAPAAPR